MPEVFISFTHKDNERLSDEQQGWIDRFHEALHKRLDQLWGRETQIWRDPKITGNDLLTPVIEKELQASALLVSVLSPSYLNSKWCNDELRMFCEACSRAGGLVTENKCRIVKAIKTPVDATIQCAAKLILDDSLGYSFFRYDDKGIPWEFDPNLGAQERQEFLRQVNELAYGLCKTLQAVRGGKLLYEVVQPSGLNVFLAESSYDLGAESAALRRELEQFGHTVLPESPLSYAPDYAQRARALLRECRLSVHPMGKQYGVIPEGEDRSVVAVAYEVAQEETVRRPDFVRLPWIPPGMTPTDQRQQAFVRSLQDDPRLLVTSLENFKTNIKTVLSAAHDGQHQIRPPAATPAIYFICDPIDADSSLPIEDFLFAQGLEITRSLAAGDERELRRDHEENLKSCDAAIIYHGLTTPAWLRSKLRDLQKAFGYGRQRPFRARAVVLGEPASVDKQRFRSNEVQVVSSFAAFDSSKLKPFLSAVRARAEDAS